MPYKRLIETKFKGLRRLFKLLDDESYNNTHLLILINRRKHLISHLNKPKNSITEVQVNDNNSINLSLDDIIKTIIKTLETLRQLQ